MIKIETVKSLQEEFATIRDAVTSICKKHPGVNSSVIQGNIRLQAHRCDKAVMLAAKAQVASFLLKNNSRKFNHKAIRGYRVWNVLQVDISCGIKAQLNADEHNAVLFGVSF